MTDVDPYALPLEPGKVLAHGAPIRNNAQMFVGHPVGCDDPVVQWCHTPALAGELGGNSLKDLGRKPGVYQDAQLRLTEHVDESRRHHHSCGIDAVLGLSSDQGSDGSDSAVLDAYITRVPGRAGAIDDAAIPDDDVVVGLLRFERAREEEQRQKTQKAAHDTSRITYWGYRRLPRCHSERSEESRERPSGNRTSRSFATLRMTAVLQVAATLSF
jgi:hypothetical protein